MKLRMQLNRFGYYCRWLWIGLATVACAGGAELCALFVPRRARADLYRRFARRWGRLFLLGVRCSFDGAQHIPRDGAVIFASNHQSAFDIPLFHALMPVPFRWMSKSAFFSWSFVGRALRNMKAIGVNAGSRSAIRRSWQEAVEALRSGDRIVIFPEGTWGDREGRMLPFQKGVISIAREANVPVVPITIAGSNRVNPPRTREIHRGSIRMTIHPSLGPGTWEGLSDDAWLEKLRSTIAGAL